MPNLLKIMLCQFKKQFNLASHESLIIGKFKETATPRCKFKSFLATLQLVSITASSNWNVSMSQLQIGSAHFDRIRGSPRLCSPDRWSVKRC